MKETGGTGGHRNGRREEVWPALPRSRRPQPQEQPQSTKQRLQPQPRAQPQAAKAQVQPRRPPRHAGDPPARGQSLRGVGKEGGVERRLGALSPPGGSAGGGRDGSEECPGVEGGNDAEVLKAMAGIHAEMLLRGWCPHLLVELHLLLSILQVVVREGCDCTHTPSPPQPGSWFHSVGELRFYLHEVLWRCLPLLDACVGPVAPWQALFATSTSSSPFSSSSSPLCGAPAVGSLLCPTERASHTPSSMGGPRRGQPPDTASSSAPSAAPATSSSSSSSSLGSATHSFSLGEKPQIRVDVT